MLSPVVTGGIAANPSTRQGKGAPRLLPVVTVGRVRPEEDCQLTGVRVLRAELSEKHVERMGQQLSCVFVLTSLEEKGTEVRFGYGAGVMVPRPVDPQFDRQNARRRVAPTGGRAPAHRSRGHTRRTFVYRDEVYRVTQRQLMVEYSPRE